MLLALSHEGSNASLAQACCAQDRRYRGCLLPGSCAAAGSDQSPLNTLPATTMLPQQRVGAGNLRDRTAEFQSILERLQKQQGIAAATPSGRSENGRE